MSRRLSLFSDVVPYESAPALDQGGGSRVQFPQSETKSLWEHVLSSYTVVQYVTAFSHDFEDSGEVGSCYVIPNFCRTGQKIANKAYDGRPPAIKMVLENNNFAHARGLSAACAWKA
ncbi:hypothetical protein EVAR_18223_1 [Eumeta japonica]|uniref:Uncharacterized protein n=1 Tax=Eumeta variegata TaxID=151549 RepID=A0A4C1UKU2_EUMVA|nr:hypothetical protein EVAR_18223_1 [Eumeta japonica]